MSRITKAFATSAKVAYLTAGDGVPESINYFRALLNAGVNVLEIGIPFSDPVADGVTIQLAMQRALNNGANLDSAIELITQLRATTDAAIIVFTYYNPIFAQLENFLKKIKLAGADGILVVDLPFEENQTLRELCQQLELSPIMVASVSTPLARIKLLSDNSSGFLYYACRAGTTGMQNKLPEDIKAKVKLVRQYSALPIAVGFGISTAAMVREVLSIANGCVIGSYFVEAIAAGKTPAELQTMAAEIFNIDKL